MRLILSGRIKQWFSYIHIIIKYIPTHNWPVSRWSDCLIHFYHRVAVGNKLKWFAWRSCQPQSTRCPFIRSIYNMHSYINIHLVTRAHPHMYEIKHDHISSIYKQRLNSIRLLTCVYTLRIKYYFLNTKFRL